MTMIKAFRETFFRSKAIRKGKGSGFNVIGLQVILVLTGRIMNHAARLMMRR